MLWPRIRHGMSSHMLQQRKHIRLRNFSYASSNAYFITICVKYFQPLLGSIKNGICGLSEIGCVAALNLQNIPDHYPHASLDEYIIMPNHLHCILFINRPDHFHISNDFGRTVAGSVSTIIGHVKGAVTKWSRENKISLQWQPRFYDHVIRDEKEYRAIKNYIINNPRNWKDDRFYQ
jgi:REP element-mobilizing transposase RayT